MERVVAVTVLVLVQTSLLQCRRLPATADLTHFDSNQKAANHSDLAERYGLLPTPNIATSILNPLVASDVSYFNADADLLHIKPTISVSSYSDWSQPEDPEESSVVHHKRHRKIYDNDKLWTKLHNKKHFVEIVPIRHKSKFKSKGKALAYIVPKSDIVKNKLKKQKRISGIVVTKNIPDINNIVFESSEENSNADDPSYHKDSSDPVYSDSDEWHSSEEYERQNQKYGLQAFAETDPVNLNSIINVKDQNSEYKINNKINDIISYFKDHNDGKLDSVVHDLIPIKEEDNNYRVHYIIHKKHQLDKNSHNFEDTTNSHSASHEANHYYEPLVDDADDIKSEHIQYVNPVAPTYETSNIFDNHHGHKKIRDSSERDLPIHSPLNTVYELDVKPKHNEHHFIHELSHESHSVAEQDNPGYITLTENNNAIREPHSVVEQEHNTGYITITENEDAVHEPYSVVEQDNAGYITITENKDALHDPHSIAEQEHDTGYITKTKNKDAVHEPPSVVEQQNTGFITVTENKDGIFHDIHNIHSEIPIPSLHIYNIDKDDYSPEDKIQVISHVDDPEHHHIHIYDSNTGDMNSIERHQSDSTLDHINKSQSNSDSSNLNIESASEDSNKSDSEIKDSSKIESDENSSSTDSNLNESSSSESDEDHSSSDESREIDESTDLSPEDGPYVHGHGLHDVSSDESASSEGSVEHEETPHYHSNAEVTFDPAVHEFILPDCLKLKKHKGHKNCSENCGHKSYKLTFMFNR